MAHNDNCTFFPPDRNLMGHSILLAFAAWVWHGGAVYVPHQGYFALDIPDAGNGIYDMPPVEEVCLAHQTVACRQKKGCRGPVSYTHLRAHETRHDLVCRLLLEKKKK